MLLDLLYLAAALLLLPWVAWRKLSGGRPVAAPWRRFLGAVPRRPREPGVARLWLHGVSVGEVQLLAVLAAEIDRQAERDRRRVECLVSSSTVTGLDVAAKRFGSERVFACPLDFSWAVARTLRAVEPDLLVLGELELWPNLLAAASRRGIPVIVANGRMSAASARGYARIAPLVRRMLGHVRLVTARSADDAERFRRHGARDVTDVGSMKFDLVKGDRDAPDVCRLRALAGFGNDDIVFLAGSTQDPEERLALETFVALRDRHPALRLVIVPRHVERTPQIAALLDRSGVGWRARSTLATGGAPPDARVVLVDTTGELAWWWGVATVAFVGGSLDGRRGGQNMLEPAAYGAATCFGPFTRNFAVEVATLLAADAATVVADGTELTAFVARCLDDPGWAAARGARARATVAGHRGATAATARRIVGCLPPAAPPSGFAAPG
ncbi:MAG: 3-deoxy-D-manno-octulosonic acid transferase [Planctomycetaceae bacterium]